MPRLVHAVAVLLSAVLAAQTQPAERPAAAAQAEAVTRLEVREVSPGRGELLATNDVATLRWLATKDDGRVYEDRRTQEPPMQLRVGPHMPPFWEEALPQMRPGGRYRVAVPIDRMGPADRRPAALQGCKHVIYEVHCVDVFRLPRFRALDAAKAKPQAGFPSEELAAGTGAPPAPDHWCSFHFVAWNAAGEEIDSSHALGKPLRSRPDAVAVPFLAAILPRMRPGARWLCTSPVRDGHPRWADILGPDTVVTWQVELLAVTPPLPLPAFAPPAATDMRASTSGVRVRVDGARAEAEAPADVTQVRVHFACWLADGTLVDATYPAGQPSELVLAKLPAGMREGMLRIPGGGAGWVRIPAAQGYGAQGLPARKVPPDAELILRVELLAAGR